MLPETNPDIIYVPAATLRGGYRDLATAVDALLYPDACIPDIIRQNVRYRDYEREHGARAAVNLLVEEAPALGRDAESLSRSVYLLKSSPIADYDIQAWPIDKPFTLCGHRFESLRDLQACVEMTGDAEISRFSYFSMALKDYKHIDGLHVGSVTEGYPRFDSYDDCDTRSYQNFMISREPITKGMIKAFAGLPVRTNYCKVEEKIPAEWLPLVYYVGDYNYIQIATPKD